MATKKFLEVSGQSDEQLTKELTSTVTEYQQMRFDHYTRGVDDVARIKVLRRDIARLKTEQSRRELTKINDGKGRPTKGTRRSRLKAKQA